MYEQLRRYLVDLLHGLVKRRQSRIEEGYLIPDHVNMLITIHPKYAISQLIKYIKGKSAIHLIPVYGEPSVTWSDSISGGCGYFVSTVVRTDEMIQEYIRS